MKFQATLKVHGANPDGIVPFRTPLNAPDIDTAIRRAMDLAGDAVGCSDFAYRDLADGSITILDTVCGSAKIASLRVAAA